MKGLFAKAFKKLIYFFILQIIMKITKELSCKYVIAYLQEKNLGNFINKFEGKLMFTI